MARYKVIINKDGDDEVQYTLYRKIWKYHILPRWEFVDTSRSGDYIAGLISDFEWRKVVKTKMELNK